MSNVTNEAIAAKLDEARALIEKGWTQDSYHDRLRGVDCYCSLGAIAGATGEDPACVWQFEEARLLALAVAGENCTGMQVYEVVTDWNDAPERTQAEVVEAFRKAALLARGGGQ